MKPLMRCLTAAPLYLHDIMVLYNFYYLLFLSPFDMKTNTLPQLGTRVGETTDVTPDCGLLWNLRLVKIDSRTDYRGLFSWTQTGLPENCDLLYWSKVIDW